MAHWMSEKLKPYQPSIFDSLGRLARKHGCVNLGQGFPDFDGPDLVKKAAVSAIEAGHNQYAPLSGIPALNQILADIYREQAGLDYDPAEEITIFNGATGAMYAALTAVCEPGDHFITFAPVYDTYIPAVTLSGGRVTAVPLRAPSFEFDPEELRAAFSPQTKAIIVNTPHNPTGRVFNEAELNLIRELCIEHDVLAITDEVYEYLVFDHHRHIHLASLPGMRDRTITISSTAKTLSLTGWKIGYALAPPEATRAMRRMHQFVCFAVATPLQMGIARGFQARAQLIPPLQKKLAAKRNLLCDALDQIGFKTVRPEGTFFCLADFSNFSTKRDLEFAKDLIENETGVALIPISVFYPDASTAPTNYLRFCFAKKDSTLQQGLAQLEKMRK